MGGGGGGGRGSGSGGDWGGGLQVKGPGSRVQGRYARRESSRYDSKHCQMPRKTQLYEGIGCLRVARRDMLQDVVLSIREGARQ